MKDFYFIHTLNIKIHTHICDAIIKFYSINKCKIPIAIGTVVRRTGFTQLHNSNVQFISRCLFCLLFFVSIHCVASDAFPSSTSSSFIVHLERSVGQTGILLCLSLYVFCHRLVLLLALLRLLLLFLLLWSNKRSV